MSNSLQKSNGSENQNGQGISKYIPRDDFEREKNMSNEIGPKEIISYVLKYKWLILFFLIIGSAGAWVYADFITPVYQSKGTLMVTSSKNSTDDKLSQVISKATGHGTGASLVNELQILQSRQFSEQIASNLIENEQGGINEFPVLWIKEEDGDVHKAGEETVSSRIRNNIEFMRPVEEADVVEVRFSSTSPKEAAKVVNKAMEIYVEKSTRQNRQAASSTAEFLEKEKKQIEQKLRASEERLRQFMDSTGIVQIDKQASSMVSERGKTEAELQNVNLELRTVEETISKLEGQLENIKPGLSEEFSDAIGPRIKSLQEELARNENEKTLIITKNPGVLDRDPLPARLRQLNNQISSFKNEIKKLSEQLFTEGEFSGLDSGQRAQKVLDIQTKLVDLRIKQNQLESRSKALKEHKEEMDSEFNSLPKGMVKLAKLKRDVRINEELYVNLSRQYADMAVWKQSQFGNGRIVDSGEIPGTPVSPNKKMLMILGLMFGGVVSAGFIAIREFMDDSVSSVSQLRTISHPSLTLTVVPSIEATSKSKKHRKSISNGEGRIPDEIVLVQDRFGIASESIRRLKNNIIYQYGEHPPNTIAVTSSEKGDGKSTIVANLGIAFAEEGYKTLVIDTDFRRPKIQEYFGLSENTGLTDYLSGNISVKQVIQNTNLNNLKVITAGNKTQRPEIIVSSKAFKHFLEKVKEASDVIIFDTPPFGVISDSTALLKEVEATVLVARYRKTNRGMLFRTLEDLGQIQANVTNIVLNDFDHKKETDNYYGAGYYQSLYANYEDYLN